MFKKGGLVMKRAYSFDHFTNDQKKAEINRLTANVESHSKTLAELLLTNGLSHSKKVLDVGCGTGAMIDLFASILKGTEFHGVDNSSHILKAAKARLEQKYDNTQLTSAEADRLPFSDHTFDFVFTRLVLMHNSNPETIINEIIRVCKPGGTICAIEIDDGTQVFHPYGEELNRLIQANIQFAARHGTDRTMGRKLYSYFSNNTYTEVVKVIIQTSDYSSDLINSDELPILLKFALGKDEGKRFVDANLLTEELRHKLVTTYIPAFCNSPHRFESCSFMYAFAKKK